ncbi:MAG: YitT family protein [Bacilli bacterium]|nr:YitT family protein [Bacilli bacterium]
MKKVKSSFYFREFLSYVIITIGVIISSFAIDTIILPNNILDGGVTGISIIISKLTPLEISNLIFILNIPFILMGYKSLGKRFLIKSIYSMLLYSLFLFLFNKIDPLTDQLLLATVYGGFMLGLGCGIVIKMGGCLDGTESAAIVLNKKFHISVGQIILFFNLAIFGTSALVFGVDRALYSLLTYFITFKVIDVVSEGLEQGKAAMIITDSADEISKQIYSRLGRTTTLIKGDGLISGKKEVLYCVLTRMEISELRKIAEEVDESVFITITDVSEIIGNHIKSTKNIKNIKK